MSKNIKTTSKICPLCKGTGKLIGNNENKSLEWSCYMCKAKGYLKEKTLKPIKVLYI